MSQNAIRRADFGRHLPRMCGENFAKTETNQAQYAFLLRRIMKNPIITPQTRENALTLAKSVTRKLKEKRLPNLAKDWQRWHNAELRRLLK